MYLMLTATTSDSISTSSTIQRTREEMGYQFKVTRTPPSEGGGGWNVTASQHDSCQSGKGEVSYQGRYGKVYTGFNSVLDNQYSYMGATGSVVVMGGGLSAARQINKGFAVVSTDGIPYHQLVHTPYRALPFAVAVTGQVSLRRRCTA